MFNLLITSSAEILPFGRFKLSPDLKYVMLAFRPQRLFRHSFLAQYDIYNVATGRSVTPFLYLERCS